MVLTNAGRIALRMGELNFAFTDGYSGPLPNIVLHENVIMPNHVYGIVQILGYGRCRGEKYFALTCVPMYVRTIIPTYALMDGQMFNTYVRDLGEKCFAPTCVPMYVRTIISLYVPTDGQMFNTYVRDLGEIFFAHTCVPRLPTTITPIIGQIV